MITAIDGPMKEPLWRPDQTRVEGSHLSAFMEHVLEKFGVDTAGEYFRLHDWAVKNSEHFWSGVWGYCGVRGIRGKSVLQDAELFPGARWFPDARLNYAENLLWRRAHHPALVSLLENGERREFNYAELYRCVAQFAASLKAMGVVSGDRVVGFMPNLPEAVIAALAAASVGATWSSCSPDFGFSGVMDRFGQIEPVLMVAAGTKGAGFLRVTDHCHLKWCVHIHRCVQSFAMTLFTGNNGSREQKWK